MKPNNELQHFKTDPDHDAFIVLHGLHKQLSHKQFRINTKPDFFLKEETDRNLNNRFSKDATHSSVSTVFKWLLSYLDMTCTQNTSSNKTVCKVNLNREIKNTQL